MASSRLFGICCMLIGGGIGCADAFAADALGLATEAPSYDSDYADAARLRGAFDNTPEADARPGEYYFVQGVQAFRKKEYTFAIQMYEVSASWAYKPAEYNLGVIYSRGQGVPVDLPRGMAWMALAAERGDQRYVDAREAVYAELTPEQFTQANAIWRELKPTYGDEVALKRAKARWADVRSHMTGSRVGSVGNLSVGMPNANGGDPSNAKGNTAGGNVHSTAGTAAEATGGNGVDGSVAYRSLRASDNPYDPKFDRAQKGTATVGPASPVKDGDASAKSEPDKQPQ